MSEEANNVIWFEMQDGKAEATFHITLRSLPTESEYQHMERVKKFILSLDPSADLNLKLKDAPRYTGGGRRGKESVEIKDGKFLIKSVTRIERPNKKTNQDGTPQAPWSFLRAFGEQDGQEVFADCFVGNPSWKKPQNPITENQHMSNPFPNFFSWAVDQKKDATGLGLTAVVSKNQQYKSWDVIDLTTANAQPVGDPNSL